ncbi:hypothetical protein MFUM_710028 [Methylacidiphilum fumariolicum SolV]|uniref:Uncharacterized protein n=2 Tax=Candidatus Methylacidiphilum fumarolicum TaxID=591154 RepID=I0JZG2_METFB|nr:conserved protein of unknown function [Candidatus Methylacidiphilum fumarolicum]CCG92631.1 hypothetical protein MFUM_710028 [Methylacidiphilum fumariolicum SolV]
MKAAENKKRYVCNFARIIILKEEVCFNHLYKEISLASTYIYRGLEYSLWT